MLALIRIVWNDFSGELGLDKGEFWRLDRIQIKEKEGWKAFTSLMSTPDTVRFFFIIYNQKHLEKLSDGFILEFAEKK